MEKIDESIPHKTIQGAIASDNAAAGINGAATTTTNGTTTAVVPEKATTSSIYPAASTASEHPIKVLMRLRTKEVAQGWIMYIRFARRAEGFASARKVFGKARKSKHLDWRVYEFAGLIFFSELN